MSAIFVYRILQILGIPLIVVYFFWRGLKDRRYFHGFGERLGFLPRSYRQTGHRALWLHTVSVGEVLAAAPLARALRARFPAEPLFVSTTTLAGKAAAIEKLRGLADGVFYCPLDFPFAVRRVLRTLRPRAVVIFETEIWPNLYREAKRNGCALLIVNGRISDRAMPRYRRFRWFFRETLALPDAILAQGPVSYERYVELGAPRAKVIAAGNLKYDFDPQQLEPPAAVARFIQNARPSAIWIAASTMPPAAPGDPDEDETVVGAFAELAARHRGLLLLLVPRKPERFDVAAGVLARAGIPFLRRSALEGNETCTLPAALLVDSIGELGSLFRLADVVFMGGTLAHRGGHNVIEPAFFGKPVVVGPHMENFPEIAAKFADAGALVPIAHAGELANAVGRLLASAERRGDVGERARAAAESERGATARAVSEIERRVAKSIPRYRVPAPARLLLWPLSRLWLLGAAWLRKTPQSVATPVISVGGLTVGGTGKTPLVLWLARRLRERGYLPAILTRGYRRRAAERATILGPGESATADRTGDEAQSYVRAALGPVGIGADRLATAGIIEQRFSPSVFLLDDGFQHHRLARSLDLVVLDALDPFGGGEVVPLGRLREEPAALARAGAVIVTRVEPGRDIAAIEARVRHYNPNVPVFAARVVPRGWKDAARGPAAPPPAAAAFCGLGNPDAFWRTLRALGIEPAFRRVFPDHHRYTAAELAALAAAARAAGAEALLTTEKDLANLPAGWEDAVAPLRILWLEIGLEIDQAEALMRLVEAPLSRSSRNFLRSSPPP
ncbi:MAG TPA: tetraacyldisaccharide 4'-kinase [Bryobacteraceae bacterium]|nr:tetraacyldisaccharide 4'-kinase [Bryobacteraceae bacterium]